jgi:hypothetical protein
MITPHYCIVGRTDQKGIFIMASVLVAVVATFNVGQLAKAQLALSTIQGQGLGQVTSPCIIAAGFTGGGFPAAIAFQASGTNGALTGAVLIANPNGEQGIFGNINGGTITKNQFTLQGNLQLALCGTLSFTLTGLCGTNVPIRLIAGQGDLIVTAKGSVTCNV